MTVVISLFQAIIREIWKIEEGPWEKNILPYTHQVCTRKISKKY